MLLVVAKKIKPHAKFQNPRTTLSWEKVTQAEEEIEEKMPLIVNTCSC
jgi:hypothetical protein